jgi:hypothetical protein
MAQILDLGSGRGMLKHYYSPYANLHFELKPSIIRRFYSLGFLSRDEYYHWMLYFGYSYKETATLYALDVALCELERKGYFANLKRKEVDYG